MEVQFRNPPPSPRDIIIYPSSYQYTRNNFTTLKDISCMMSYSVHCKTDERTNYQYIRRKSNCSTQAIMTSITNSLQFKHKLSTSCKKPVLFSFLNKVFENTKAFHYESQLFLISLYVLFQYSQATISFHSSSKALYFSIFNFSPFSLILYFIFTQSCEIVSSNNPINNEYKNKQLAMPKIVCLL